MELPPLVLVIRLTVGSSRPRHYNKGKREIHAHSDSVCGAAGLDPGHREGNMTSAFGRHSHRDAARGLPEAIPRLDIGVHLPFRLRLEDLNPVIFDRGTARAA